MAISTGDAVPGELITAAWGDQVRSDLSLLSQAVETYALPALGTDITLSSGPQFVTPGVVVTTPAGYSSATFVATFVMHVEATANVLAALYLQTSSPTLVGADFFDLVPAGAYGQVVATIRGSVTVGGSTTVTAAGRFTSGTGKVLANRSFGHVIRVAVL